MIDTNDAWYRISAKALIFDDIGRIMLCKEQSGVWDIPGGGLDHHEAPEDCIRRELLEEMGLHAISIDKIPMCFITAHKEKSASRPWIANICFRVTVENFDFVPTHECVEIGFFDRKSLREIQALPNVEKVFEKIFG